MSLLGQYIPEPPAIVELIQANAQEAITKDQQQSGLRSKSEFERNADTTVSGLARLCADARDNGIDFERVIHEIVLLEKTREADTEKLRQSLRQIKKSIRLAIPNVVRGGVLKPADIEEMRQAAAFAEWLLSLRQRVTIAFQDCRRTLETLRDIRLAEYSSEWENYLSKLEKTTSVADEVRRVWSHLKPLLWAPEVSPTDDGDFIMVWDRGQHHLQVRILPSGLYDWFYRNRDTNEVRFEEDLVLNGQYSNLDAIVSRIA